MNPDNPSQHAPRPAAPGGRTPSSKSDLTRKGTTVILLILAGVASLLALMSAAEAIDIWFNYRFAALWRVALGVLVAAGAIFALFRQRQR